MQLSFHGSKWQIGGYYHPPSRSVNYFIYYLGIAIGSLSLLQDNFAVLGDFNTENSLKQFLSSHDAKNKLSKKNMF